MRKVLTILIWLAMVILMLVGVGNSKEVDFSVTFSGIYDMGEWSSGYARNVTGTLKEEEVDFAPSLQIKYTGWKIQPTFEFNWRGQNFNFSNWEQRAHVNKNSYDFLFGVTYDFNFFTSYLLGGLSHWESEGFLTESMPNPMKYHGRFKNEKNLFALKLGAYKLWDIKLSEKQKIRIGPELAIEGLVGETGFNRCRDFETNHVIPYFGVRVQY